MEDRHWQQTLFTSSAAVDGLDLPLRQLEVRRKAEVLNQVFEEKKLNFLKKLKENAKISLNFCKKHFCGETPAVLVDYEKFYSWHEFYFFAFIFPLFLFCELSSVRSI